MSKIFKVSNYIFLILFLLNMSGCSGCSPSGRRSHQKTVPYKRSTTNTTHLAEKERSVDRSPQKSVASLQHPLPLNELYNRYKNSVFLVYTSDGDYEYQGSGFFISKNGLAVSNYHVFEGTSQGLEVIETIDGTQFKIQEVLDKSKEYDYIIFQVRIDNYNIVNPISIVSQMPYVGEDVFAIGNPRGLESTLSKGIVSGFRGNNNTLIQTTAEITHGSSGGPLLNMRGQVVGITTSGLGEANLNFAINIETLNLNRFK